MHFSIYQIQTVLIYGKIMRKNIFFKKQNLLLH